MRAVLGVRGAAACGTRASRRRRRCARCSPPTTGMPSFGHLTRTSPNRHARGAGWRTAPRAARGAATRARRRWARPRASYAWWPRSSSPRCSCACSPTRTTSES